MTLTIDDLFTVPVINLGIRDQRFDGIYIPKPELDAERSGITEQFLENAEVYHSRYSASEHWTGMFERIFSAVGKPSGKNLNILDVGTGSGVNTVIPCLKLFEDCSLIGTDLSPQLLAILRSYVRSEGLEDRVFCVCTDAMQNHFKPESFDIVVGGSILHHLVDPVAALIAVRRALKPGGIAVFIEPFEGYNVVRIAFDLIASEAGIRGDLSQKALSFMSAMCRDLEVRSGSDKSSPIFQHLDDKWLFTRSYLQKAASTAGFESTSFVPMFDAVSQYRNGMSGLLRMGGLDPEHDLPSWTWEYIDIFDRTFSADLKAEATLESGIVFRR